MILRHQLKEKISAWKKAATKVAASVAILIVVSSTVLISVEASRNYIFNVVIKWQEDYFSIEHSDAIEENSIVYSPKYLPKGFKEVSSNAIGNIFRTIYKNETGVEIILKQTSAQSSKLLTDHEDKKVTTIKINQQEAYLVEASELNKNNIVLWEYNGIMFSIASEVESAELILIAESIKK